MYAGGMASPTLVTSTPTSSRIVLRANELGWHAPDPPREAGTANDPRADRCPGVFAGLDSPRRCPQGVHAVGSFGFLNPFVASWVAADGVWGLTFSSVDP